ncbi:hypothetical protein ACFQ58_12350 [Agromyces sp. NPDC056523]|uniref:hypothetical protein n=1 Tax=Agromyces sp. NPDC056523 TaxID=3345850 RepID=UPI00366EB7E9
MTDLTRPPARRSPAATAAVAVVVGVLITAAGHQLAATEMHRQFWPSWVAADTRSDDASAAYDEAMALGEAAVSRTEELEAVLTPDLVRDQDRTALTDALVGLRSELDEGAAAGAARLGIVELTDPDAFAPAWERYADLWEISELVPERIAAAESSEAATDAVQAARDEVDAATETLVAGAHEIARAELAANPSATFRARSTLQQLVDGAASTTDAAGFTALVTAVADVRASHAAAVARADANPVRAEIEAFARSIANGVALDFAWAYEVAGLESDTWYSGTAEFGVDGGEWGLITLSESIEWAWGNDPNAEAVVVHEVGHTQVIREACRALFEEAGSDHESWATAWAISMGYDLPGAGIEAYGRPSDAQVAAAAECR